MKLAQRKLFIGFSVLFAFVGMAVFGLLPFSHETHESGAPMVNCPYAEEGYAICENTLEHINRWQEFSNLILPSLIVLLAVFLAVYFIGRENLFDEQKRFSKWKYYVKDNVGLYTYAEDIAKWLSLFENSPSFSYVRHS